MHKEGWSKIFICNGPNWEHPKWPITGAQIDGLLYGTSTQGTTWRHEVSTHTTQVNLTDLLLSEKSQIQRV